MKKIKINVNWKYIDNENRIYFNKRNLLKIINDFIKINWTKIKIYKTIDFDWMSDSYYRLSEKEIKNSTKIFDIEKLKLNILWNLKNFNNLNNIYIKIKNNLEKKETKKLKRKFKNEINKTILNIILNEIINKKWILCDEWFKKWNFIKLVKYWKNYVIFELSCFTFSWELIIKNDNIHIKIIK